MKIVSLRTEGYKRLTAVEITPEGNVVTIGGKNGAGKSSVLDSIWAALKGRSVNPSKPIRDGEERAIIQLDLGEIMVTRTFNQKEGERYTDTLRIERPNGDRVVTNPQQTLDSMLGEIGFDPFEFMNLKPADQAEQLLAMVPLPIDLDEHAELDASDYERRREVNREIERLEGRLSGYPAEQLPEQIPDREALVAKLGNASSHNLAIDREKARRESVAAMNESAARRIATLESQIAEMQREMEEEIAAGRARQEELNSLPPLDQPIDVQELQEEIRQAENTAAIVARQDARKAILAELENARAESTGFTEAMAAREKEREAALSKAKMPVDGLGFRIGDKGKPIVTYQGLPFEKDQISTAAALRVSTAIAMAANPTLRVLQIRDGSLLDEDAMAALAEMAEAEDYQLWIERVGTEGAGIIIEDGHVREPEGGAQ